MTQAGKVEMAPGIRHHLMDRGRSRKGAIRTVGWITKDGEQRTLTGRLAGWTATDRGAQYLVLEVHEGNQGPARYRTEYVGAKAIARFLDATGQTPRPSADLVERCQECGKALGTGPLGYMDEFAAAPGYCYDCV
jgi:hypothetical protein